MNKSVIFLIVFFVVSCKEKIVQEIDPRLYNDAFHGNIIGMVIQKESNAVVTVSQIDPIAWTLIDPKDGSFRLENLEIGNYDLIIEADNYRIYKYHNVKVEGAGTTYLGEIDLSDIPDLVSSHYPQDEQEIVYNNNFRRLTISVSFTQPMDRESVEQAFTTDPPSEGIFHWGQYSSEPSVVYFAGNNSDLEWGYIPEATISTYSKITSFSYQMAQKDSYVDTTYHVSLATTAHDTSGNYLRFPLQFSFSTVQSATTIYGIQTFPYHGDTGVELIASNGIQLTFPRNMDQNLTESAVSITPTMDYLFIWPAYNQLTIYTGGVFLADTTYKITIDSTAKDLDGISMGKPFQFSFHTTKVNLESTYPRNGQLFVNYDNLKIYLYFNTFMKKSSVEHAFNITPPIDGIIDWSSSSSTTTLCFLPVTDLIPNTKYTITLAETAEDLFGSHIQEPYSFSFITRPE
jgi:hypothetical protein